MTVRTEFPTVEPVPAWRFALVDSDGALKGGALVCPDARYLSVMWVGSSRFDRRHAAAKAWPLIQGEVKVPALGADLSASTTAAHLIAGDTGARVRMMGLSLITERPHELAAALDSRLRQFLESELHGADLPLPAGLVVEEPFDPLLRDEVAVGLSGLEVPAGHALHLAAGSGHTVAIALRHGEVTVARAEADADDDAIARAARLLLAGVSDA